MGFVLPAFNGKPFTLSSGFVCSLVAILLLVRGPSWAGRPLPQHAASVGIALAAWVVAAGLSTVGNLAPTAALNFLWGYLLPLMMFIAVVRLSPAAEDLQWVIASFSAGLVLRLGYGALVFYAEWGIPSPTELLLAHYDVVRMESYMNVTFGSTGNTAAIVAVMFPVLVLSLLVIPMIKHVRIIVIAGVAVLAVTAFITGSRASLLIVMGVLVLASFQLRGRWRYALLGALVIAAYLFINDVEDKVANSFQAAVAVDAQTDESIAERLDSMNFGLRMMLDHPVGVGPGMSFEYNPYGVPHQFAIAQGSDIGVLGMVTSSLLAALIILRMLISILIGKGGADPTMPFRYGAFTWMLYAMIANITTNSGPTVPWVGLLAICLALSNIEASNRTSRRDPRHVLLG
jgi:hypothetical protein